MKYKGIELKEVTESQIFDPPKKMVVWDTGVSNPIVVVVFSIDNRREYRVIGKSTDWKHCAEIPEPQLATNSELSQWLAKGNGSLKKSTHTNIVYTNLSYDESIADKPIDDFALVRKWKDTEWHKPTREYLGLEDK